MISRISSLGRGEDRLGVVARRRWWRRAGRTGAWAADSCHARAPCAGARPRRCGEAPAPPSAQVRRAAAGRTRSARSARTRVADRLAHPLAPAACGPRGSSARARRRASWRTRAGAVGRPRARRPSRSAPQRALATRAPRDRRAGRSWAPRSSGASGGSRARRRWSAGSARWCRRPGARPGTGGARARRRGRRRSARPWVSFAVETTPAGLLRRRRRGARPRARPARRRRATSLALVDVARRVGDDLAVDAHPPGAQMLLGGAARGDARVGEVLGEAHAAASP